MYLFFFSFLFPPPPPFFEGALWLNKIFVLEEKEQAIQKMFRLHTHDTAR